MVDRIIWTTSLDCFLGPVFCDCEENQHVTEVKTREASWVEIDMYVWIDAYGDGESAFGGQSAAATNLERVGYLTYFLSSMMVNEEDFERDWCAEVLFSCVNLRILDRLCLHLHG